MYIKNGKPRIFGFFAAYFRSKNARGLSYPVILPMLPRKLQYSSYRN